MLFAVLWLGVFAQMVSGHDPVLGSGPSTKLARNTTTKQRSNPQPARKRAEQSEWVMDPTTGEIYRVPSGSEQAATSSQPAPVSPAPVVTSQS